MNEIKGESNVTLAELSQTKMEVELIEQQLQLKGIDEIRMRIQEVQRALKEAEEKIEFVRNELPVKRAQKDVCKQQLDAAAVREDFWSRLKNEWEKIVEGEISLQFVEVEENHPEAIVVQLSDVLERYDRSKLNEQLTKTFLNEQMQLTEYRMIDYTETAEKPDWFANEWGDDYAPFMNEWQQLQGRRIIQMEYQGQRVSPYFVLSSLEKELVEQKGWLDEQDRQLYEDIIVNTVGVILRNRIQRAQKWVREMDQIMKNRDNSSGLTFSINWKPLTAESEQELDTQDLVSLLQRNSKFLNEEDLSRITKHFQSRIEKAKELIQLRNEGSTLHQVLKEVLDYRKWFTFVLSYKRMNEPKRRELTNHAFFQFSGGEKAMAMYIPLFTAAYSRYKEASDMAPYIITLDEALRVSMKIIYVICLKSSNSLALIIL
ncbi:SbcC/MukB-like Walker B domain-containing protein [Bacillus sp. N9]